MIQFLLPVHRPAALLEEIFNMRRLMPFIGAIVLLFNLLLSACNVPLGSPTPASESPAATVTSSSGPATNPEPTPTQGSREGDTQPAGAGSPVNPAAGDSDSMVDETPQGSTNNSGGAASLPGEDFAAKLFRTFEARDVDGLRPLMRDRFSIATFNQSLYEYSSDEALEKLRQSVLADGATPAVRPGTDVVTLLSGRDPLGEWGPVANPVRAVYVEGLGPQANQQAVLVI